jgi:transposase
MTQKERDRLFALQKAKKRLITQKQAAAEIGVSERQVRRLLRNLKERGDRAVIHAGRGRASNNKIADEKQEQAIAILSQEVYRGFGPTLAAEYLARQHQLPVSHETVRKWMIAAKLWRAKPKRIEKVHTWRARRSRFGELVQWDTSEHDWLEGRGPRLYLIAMIDDASSELTARFAESDSTAENMLTSSGKPDAMLENPPHRSAVLRKVAHSERRYVIGGADSLKPASAAPSTVASSKRTSHPLRTDMTPAYGLIGLCRTWILESIRYRSCGGNQVDGLPDAQPTSVAPDDLQWCALRAGISKSCTRPSMCG